VRSASVLSLQVLSRDQKGGLEGRIRITNSLARIMKIYVMIERML
jgi:hypothetical protein